MVIGTDAMLHGWGGLPELGEDLDRLLRPMAEGRHGSWRRWDWHRSAWAEEVTVEPPGLLVLEGVGAASAPIADLVTLHVWLEADRDVRLARWLERDGEEMRAHWSAWLADEEEHHRRHRTRERAHLRVDTGTWTG